MHIINKNENTYTFLISNQSFNVNLNEKKDLEKYFQDFFLKLKETYKININGFYEVNIYIDDTYGVALEIEKEDIDYLDYFNSSIDMKINKPKKTKFLYKTKDIFLIDKKLLAKFEIYLYNNDYYLCLTKKLNKKDLINILEFVDIIYDSEFILRNAKIIKVEV